MNVKFLILVLAALLAACGVSPHDADLGLSASVASPDDWCGFNPQPPQNTDKIFIHPDGYGLTGTYGCFEEDEEWPGGFCWAPGTQVHLVRLYTDGQDAAWFKQLTDEFGSWRDRLNTRGWRITRWSMAGTVPTMNAHTDSTTTSPGVLGESLQNTWTLHSGFDQGDYWTYAKCDVRLYRARIEANVFYQAATAAQKVKYVKNLWDHELSHCSGLAHVVEEDLLMSNVYHFPGPRFDSLLNPTVGEMDMLEDFEPLN